MAVLADRSGFKFEELIEDVFRNLGSEPETVQPTEFPPEVCIRSYVTVSEFRTAIVT